MSRSYYRGYKIVNICWDGWRVSITDMVSCYVGYLDAEIPDHSLKSSGKRIAAEYIHG